MAVFVVVKVVGDAYFTNGQRNVSIGKILTQMIKVGVLVDLPRCQCKELTVIKAGNIDFRGRITNPVSLTVRCICNPLCLAQPISACELRIKKYTGAFPESYSKEQ